MAPEVIDGTSIWCYERGLAERTIILVHPGPGLDASLFFPWFDRLADQYRIIAPDLPGHGRSESGDVASWNLSGYAARVYELARSRKLTDYILLGHSFGSWIALTFAIEYPGAASQVVASCGAAWREGDILQGLQARIDSLQPPDVRDDVVRAFATERGSVSAEEYRQLLLRELPFFVADPGTAATDALRQTYGRLSYRPAVLKHEDWGAFDLRAGLPQVQVPVLAITGSEDRATPPAAGRHIAELAPRGTYIEIPNAGHFPYIEQPDRYFEELTRWLARS